MGRTTWDAGYSMAVDSSGNVYTTGYFEGVADCNPSSGHFYLGAANNKDIFITKHDSSGNFVWAKAMGGPDNDLGYSIVVDDSGNIFTTGYFEGTVDFDPDTGVFNLTSAAAADIFISKLNSAGKFVWAKAIGGTGKNIGYSLAVDGSENIYLTGSFIGSADFDPDTNSYFLTAVAGTADVFVCKLDSSGHFLWAKAVGSTGDDEAHSVATDASGNVFYSGKFSGSVDFDPNPSVYIRTSSGLADIFISKLDSAGNFIWAKTMGGSDDDKGRSIAIDSSKNVYATGVFHGTVDFDPDAGTFNLTSTGSADLFITKFDSLGNFLWAVSMGGSNSVEARSIAINSSGSVYTTGYFSETADFDPGISTFFLTSTGSNDIFISQLNSSGNFIWAKQMGGAYDDYCYALTISRSGSIYNTGSFIGNCDFNPGAGNYTLYSFANNNDIFISKRTASGNFAWARHMGEQSSSTGKSLSIDGSGNVYTTGLFQGIVDFDPGAGEYNLTAAPGGPNSGNEKEDIFITKVNASGNLIWAKSMRGSGFGVDNGNSVVADAYGYVYATGRFENTIDLDPGVGTFYLTSLGGSDDIFISKLDSSGNFVWATALGGIDRDYGNGITADKSGNIYITGTFQGTVDFDPGIGVYYLTTVTSAYRDIYILKIDSSSHFVWAKKIGGAGDEWATSVAVDSLGNVYTTGIFQGNVDFNPGAGVFNLSTVAPAAFISKLDASGNFVWARALENTVGGTCEGQAIAIDSSENVYMKGRFRNTVDFDPGSGVFYLASLATGSYDNFVYKLDSSGNFLWAKALGGTLSFDWGYSMVLDESANVYSSGLFYGTLDFDPGAGVFNLTALNGQQGYVSKLDSSGNFVWAKATGGAGHGVGVALGINNSGNIIETGYYSGSPVIFDSTTLATGSSHAFIAELDTGASFCSASFMLFPDTVLPHTYFIISNASGVPPLNYVWSWGDSAVDTVPYPSHTYAAAGFYSICLTIYDSISCSNTYCNNYNLLRTNNTIVTINVVSPVITGITESNFHDNFSVYPNPAVHQLTIENAKYAIESVEIFDVTGRNVHNHFNPVYNRTSFQHQTVMDVSSLANGMYILKITSEKEKFATKFMKK